MPYRTAHMPPDYTSAARHVLVDALNAVRNGAGLPSIACSCVIGEAMCATCEHAEHFARGTKIAPPEHARHNGSMVPDKHPTAKLAARAFDQARDGLERAQELLGSTNYDDTNGLLLALASVARAAGMLRSCALAYSHTLEIVASALADAERETEVAALSEQVAALRTRGDALVAETRQRLRDDWPIPGENPDASVAAIADSAAMIVCARCRRSLPRALINVEAALHHHAGAFECIDRKDCERARRQSKR